MVEGSMKIFGWPGRWTPLKGFDRDAPNFRHNEGLRSSADSNYSQENRSRHLTIAYFHHLDISNERNVGGTQQAPFIDYHFTYFRIASG